MLDKRQKNLIKAKLYRAKKRPSQSVALGILAGMFIAIGALLMSIAKAEGCNKLVCGLIFSCGLFFVVITGAELFTGNCMIDGLLSYDPDRNMLKSTKLLVLNYMSNLIGAAIIFVMAITCNLDCTTLIDMAVSKCSNAGLVIFSRGVACNILVCLAVWLGVYIEPTHSKIERFIAIVFPVMAFVACGFEHSIANMFILPFGVFAGQISILQLVVQILLVTFGNWFGGIFLGVLISETLKEGQNA